MAKNTNESQKKWRVLRTIRRISQGLFLTLFVLLIFMTVSITGGSLDADSSVNVPYPVEAFLNIDPLAGIITFLSSGVVHGAMVFSLITLISAFVLGRVFCGWVCPLGTLNHITSEVASKLKGARRIKANRSGPYQITKYIILIAVLVAAIFGSAIGGLLDPLCLATRSISLTVIPAFQWLVQSAIDMAFESNNASLQHAADSAYENMGGVLIGKSVTIVAGGFLISVLFIAVLVANRFIPRLWCRAICPLGALLGLAGRFGVLTLKKDSGSCNLCKKCELHCTGAASPMPSNLINEKWKRSECELCFNCVAQCNRSSLNFGLSGRTADGQPGPNLTRRAVVGGAVVGASFVPLARTGALGSPKGRPDPARIRPPGALNELAFLKRCIRCGQCMKICPTNALHPALDEAGIEGLWTPVLVPKIGYCEPSCTLCNQVCPTGAIGTITAKQKVGSDGEEMIRIGTAFIDRGRCLPWSMNTPCIVCEEFCPISPKAIEFENHEVKVTSDEGSKTVTLKRPSVVPARCNGCGACEFVCPVHDKAAIAVSCVGESRDPAHALLLTSSPKNK